MAVRTVPALGSSSERPFKKSETAGLSFLSDADGRGRRTAEAVARPSAAVASASAPIGSLRTECASFAESHSAARGMMRERRTGRESGFSVGFGVIFRETSVCTALLKLSFPKPLNLHLCALEVVMSAVGD